MFQSDDFDILSDESFSTISEDKRTRVESVDDRTNVLIKKIDSPPIHVFSAVPKRANPPLRTPGVSSDTPNRRKRKFPGPAGLLPDALPEKISENNGDVIQSSQNYNCSQNQLPPTVFEEGAWLAMRNDLRCKWTHLQHLHHFTISYVKTQALARKLQGRKVPLLVGVVQSVDRTLQDPLIVLRDQTGEIQCTLHREAWDHLACYLVPQYSVLLLRNTTVLTTGSALKMIYLNITNNNILSVYSDEENSYSKCDSNPLSLRNSADLVPPKVYSVESISIGTEKITVLRNAFLKEQVKQSYKDTSPVAPQPISAQEASLDEDDDIIAQTLEGINPDELFDDFG